MVAFHSLIAFSFNFGSWMFIGICLLVVQCCVTLFYSLVFAEIVFKGEGFKKLISNDGFNRLCAAIGVAVTIYSGFLLTQAVGVTLWNTALWVEAAELFTIFAFVHVATSSTSAAARAGAEALLSGPQSLMFWVGVIVCGSLIPLSLNLLTRNHKALAVAATLGIIGAPLLRASVLFAGHYEPVIL